MVQNMWILRVKGKQIYVSKTSGIIDLALGATIEPCLRLYGIELLVAQDEEVEVNGTKIKGVKFNSTYSDVTEGYVVKAIETCLAYVLGVKPEKKQIGVEKQPADVTNEKTYEVRLPSNKRGDENEGEATFEPA